MGKPTLKKIGGFDYRKADSCQICERKFFIKVPFGHHLRTSWGEIDVCMPCIQDIYSTVLYDIGVGVFSLEKRREELDNFLDKLRKSRGWQKILKEAGLERPQIKYPANVQQELDKVTRKYYAIGKKYAKKSGPLRIKLNKLDDEREKFRRAMIRERTKILIKASQNQNKK